MSVATLRYHVVSQDVESLKKEVENVKEHVDGFEISGTLCRKLIKWGPAPNVKELFGNNPLLVKLHKGVDDVSTDSLVKYFSVGDVLSMPMSWYAPAKAACAPGVPFNVELDFTEDTDVDEITQNLYLVRELNSITGLKISVRANKSMLESYKECPVDVSVELATITEESVKNALTSSNGKVKSFVFKNENALSPLVELGVATLENVIDEYMTPIVNIDRVKNNLDSIEKSYVEDNIENIKEQINSIDFNDNVTKYFGTKLNFIKDYVDYKIKASPYKAAYLEHKIAMMSRANDTANLDIKLRNEKVVDKKSKLEKEIVEYEQESTTLFKTLQVAVDSIVISEEERADAEKSCDELLETYKELTKLYYNYFDEFNVLKTRINSDVLEVRTRLDSFYKRPLTGVCGCDYKNKVKAAKELLQSKPKGKAWF